MVKITNLKPHNTIKSQQYNTKFLIVGQGLAGSLLAYELLQAGHAVLMIDNHHQGAASKVAAGLVNPITGRRFVKSWMIDELLPVAIKTYGKLENTLHISILNQRNIYRALKDAGDENEWTMRTAFPDFTAYVNGEVAKENYPSGIIEPYKMGELTQSLQVDVPKLLKELKSLWLEQQILRQEPFDYDQLKISATKIDYKDISAEKIIFCEGYQTTQNPWFSYLPFVLAKGEVLIIKAPDLVLDKIYKHQTTIAPLGDNLYWIGATYNWKFVDDKPTEKGKSQLLNKLSQDIKVPFEMVYHQAAIRPTIKDRRPVLGLHPTHSSLAIFNGLGTKGTSIAPFWARKMMDLLTKEISLDKEVQIERFSSYF